MRKIYEPKLAAQLTQLKDEGKTLSFAVELTGKSLRRLKAVCRSYKINGWPVGGASRDQTGSLNPAYKNGQSRATISRMTKRILQRAGRDLFTCERCGYHRDVELPRHHKDRNRQNNSPNNLEVLCVPCHNFEHQLERSRDSANGQFIG